MVRWQRSSLPMFSIKGLTSQPENINELNFLLQDATEFNNFFFQLQPIQRILFSRVMTPHTTYFTNDWKIYYLTTPTTVPDGKYKLTPQKHHSATSIETALTVLITMTYVIQTTDIQTLEKTAIMWK